MSLTQVGFLTGPPGDAFEVGALGRLRQLRP
jgi:hypothetical protein